MEQSVNYQDMGERIRQARRLKRMTQSELAQAIGMSTSFVGHVERGNRVASIDTLVSICNALEVAPGKLLAASLQLPETNLPGVMTPEERARVRKLLTLTLSALEE